MVICNQVGWTYSAPALRCVIHRGDGSDLDVMVRRISFGDV